MRKNAETGQSGGESARDPVRNSEIEGCYSSFAEPDQENWKQQDCHKRADQCSDDHGMGGARAQVAMLWM
jgi:hypothetical protein